MSHAIPSLDFIGPEDAQLGDLKITQPPKLGHLSMLVAWKMIVDHVTKPGE